MKTLLILALFLAFVGLLTSLVYLFKLVRAGK